MEVRRIRLNLSVPKCKLHPINDFVDKTKDTEHKVSNSFSS